MAELKSKPTGASAEAFLKHLVDPARRKHYQALVRIMQRATRAKPRMWGASIVGFGSYHCKDASGREGDWFLVGFSLRKQNLTIYLMPGLDGHEALLSDLGKHRTGKSCLYLKRLADEDLDVLRELIGASVRQLKQAQG